MDLQEALAALTAANAKVDDLTTQNTSILAKNQEVLGKLRTAKDEGIALAGQVTTLKTEFETFKNQAGLDEESKQKINDLVATGIETKQAEFDTALEELTGKLGTAESAHAKLKSKYDGERIANAIRAAAEKSSAVGIDDLVLRSKGIFSVNDDGKIEARDADGNLVKSGKKILSPDVFVEEMKETAPWLWPNSKGINANGGGNDNGGVNPFAKETLNYTEQVKMRKSDPAKADRMQAAASG